MTYDRLRVDPERTNISDSDLDAFEKIAEQSQIDTVLASKALDGVASEPDILRAMDEFNETLGESAELLRKVLESDDDLTTDRLIDQTRNVQPYHLLAMIQTIEAILETFPDRNEQVNMVTGLFVRLDELHTQVVAELLKRPIIPQEHAALRQEIDGLYEPGDLNTFTATVYKKYGRKFAADLEAVRELFE